MQDRLEEFHKRFALSFALLDPSKGTPSVEELREKLEYAKKLGEEYSPSHPEEAASELRKTVEENKGRFREDL